MNLEQYDKWVIGNQKRILEWTKKYSTKRYTPIKDAFAKYHNAKSNKQKLKAFENLKKELVSSKGVSFEDLANKDYKDLIEDVSSIVIGSLPIGLLSVVTFSIFSTINLLVSV